MAKFILAGGGNSTQSKNVDEFYSSQLPNKNFLFIPQAISPEIWSFEEAFQWIKKPKAFHDTKISICSDLRKLKYEDIEKFDSLYIMGGNTFKLLHEFRKTKFIEILKKYISKNNLVYGISAGAIVLGKNILTASLGPEKDENKVNLMDLKGLNLVKDFLISTHYKDEFDEEIFSLHKSTGNPIIGIPESSAIFFENNWFKVLGYDPVSFFINNQKIQRFPNFMSSL